MSKDKYPSIFLRQIEAIVFIVRMVANSHEYSSMVITLV